MTMTDAGPDREQRSRHYPFDYWAFDHWHYREPPALGGSARAFLGRLDGPAHLYLSGEDSRRCRALVTLIHGNEPSGFIALYRLLREGLRPAVDLHCFLPNVAAARAGPGFYYRQLPGERDLNRCFRPPFDNTSESRLARGLLDTLRQLRPEAVLDIHNTSGSGPGFGVSTFMDPRHEALVSLFTHRLVVTDLSLGALMEISESLFPTVTVECGGAEDLESHAFAEAGLRRYMHGRDVLTPPSADFSLECFHRPLRLELRSGTSLTYAERPSPDHDLTLLPQIEHYNFGTTDAGTTLGFLDRPQGALLTAMDRSGREQLEHYFTDRDGRLRLRQALKLFMVTTKADIARSDCLFYFVAAAESNPKPTGRSCTFAP